MLSAAVCRVGQGEKMVELLRVAWTGADRLKTMNGPCERLASMQSNGAASKSDKKANWARNQGRLLELRWWKHHWAHERSMERELEEANGRPPVIMGVGLSSLHRSPCTMIVQFVWSFVSGWLVGGSGSGTNYGLSLSLPG